MSDTVDDGRAPGGPVIGQLAAVYLLGSLSLPLAASVFVAMLFGDPVTAGSALLVFAAVFIGGMFAAGTATRRASPATAATGRRFWWAVAVTVGGAVGLGVGAAITSALHVKYGAMESWIPVAGLPYLVIAALFIGRWIRRAAVLAVIALLVAGGYVAQQDHAHTQEARVLALLQDPLDLIYTTQIPGYRRTAAPIRASIAYEPLDQARVKYWREQDIVVTVSHTPVQGPDCGPDPLFTPVPPPVLRPTDAPPNAPDPVQPSPSPRPRPEEITCQADGDSLHYRHGPGAHEYIRATGNTVLRAGASTVVDKALLKKAVLAARPVKIRDLEKEV